MPSKNSKIFGAKKAGSTRKGSKSQRQGAGKEGTARFATQTENNQQNERSKKGLFSW